MLCQVCGTSIGLSWLFASLAHTSLPDVPKNLGENDFNAHKVFRYLDNRAWSMIMSTKVIEQLKEVVDLGPRPVGSQANLQAVQIIKCLPAFKILQAKSDVKKQSCSGKDLFTSPTWLMVRPSRQKLTIRWDLTKPSICWMSFCSLEPMHEDVCLMDEDSPSSCFERWLWNCLNIFYEHHIELITLVLRLWVGE